MSYIDSFAHELVGFFAGLPLYHPLEIINGTEVPDEFSSSPGELVLGGGPGEHPAILLTSPHGAVLYFLRYWLRTITADQATIDILRLLADGAPNIHACLGFPGWDLETYAAFFERCTAPTFATPYSKEEHGLVETWLLASLGEFVYFSMPALANRLGSDLSTIQKFAPRPVLFNVGILPPGYTEGQAIQW